MIVGLAFTIFAVSSFAAEERDVEIHGFVSQGFISTTDNNFIANSNDGTFEFNEIGINFGNKLTSKLRVGMQLFARDFGDTGNNELKIDWALADYRVAEWLGLNFGQLKVPHGFYNEYRDIDSLRPFVFLPQSIYPEITRDVTLSIQGGGIYGSIDMHAAGLLFYQALYGTQAIEPNSRLNEAVSGYPQSAIDSESTKVDRKYAGSLAYDTPLQGFRLGVSYNNTELSFNGHFNQDIMLDENIVIIPEGTNATIDFDTYENWIYSLEYTWRNLVLMAEYMDSYRKYEDSITGKGKHETTGWYVAGTYRFVNWFELGAYYSVTDSDSDISSGQFVLPDFYSELTDICVTARFDINDYWTFKLEYHTFTGAKGLSAWDNETKTENAIDYFEKDWTMFAAKLTVAF